MSTARRLLLAALPALMLLGSAVHRAEPAQPEIHSLLTSQLAAVREAWLHGDDRAAATRLDALARDSRLSGELPRWCAAMRAVLHLSAGETDKAVTVWKPLLDESQDARNYVRAARLMLAYGHPEKAAEVIGMGRARAPESAALRRIEAGLFWLAGQHDQAIDAYVAIMAADARPLYPYHTPTHTRWSEVRPWDATTEKPDGIFRTDDWGESTQITQWQPEPHTDLYTPIHWFPSDLPGLDRCILELAAEPARAKAAGEQLAALRDAARVAQQALDAWRGGADDQRAELAAKAAAARARLCIATRIHARAMLQADQWVAAEDALKASLAVTGDDVAMIDLLAEALGKLGKAEEARTGPLARLRTLTQLGITQATLNMGPVGIQLLDRIFEPSLNLYRANPAAGLVQIDAVCTAFGDTQRTLGIPPSVTGFWFALRQEPAAARRYLIESSRVSGHESGRPIDYGAMMAEMALVMIGEGTGDDAVEPDPDKPAPPDDEEADPVEVARLSADANPLLRQAFRVGGMSAACLDIRERIQLYGEVQLWSGTQGLSPLVNASGLLPEGETLLRYALFGLSARIAADVPDAELAAVLSPEHATSKTLTQAIEGMAEQMDRLRASDNWQARQSLSQRAGPVFGMVEARAILLRAQLIKSPPKDLAALTTWLETNQPQIDLYRLLRARSNEHRLQFSAQREQAKVPEIVHTGLLIDAASALARNGNKLDAARLLWFNRDAAQGLETPGRMLALAAVLADSAGDPALAARCRVMAASGTPNPRLRAPSSVLTQTELPLVRAELLEFGTEADVAAYARVMLRTTDASSFHKIMQAVPEAQGVRVDDLLFSPLPAAIDSIFQQTVQSSTLAHLRSWLPRLQLSAENIRVCRRYAAWAFATDLPFESRRGSYDGMSSALDFARCVGLLRESFRPGAANNAADIAGLDRTTRLLDRVAGNPARRLPVHEPWFD